MNASPYSRKSLSTSQSIEDLREEHQYNNLMVTMMNSDQPGNRSPVHSNQNSPSTLSTSSSMTSLQHSLTLTSKSIVHTVYSKYRIVVAIDSSQSMAVVDPSTGEVLFDRVYKVAEKLSAALAAVDEEVHVTVISVGSATVPIKTILQDVIITKDNLQMVIKKINDELINVENLTANMARDSKT
jgi:hypothetical protein